MTVGRLSLTECTESIWRCGLETPGMQPVEIFFERVDAPLPGSPHLEPFLVASLLYWMRLPIDTLVVAGDISRTLLRNLDELQTVWQRWRPGKYSKVSFVPDAVSDHRPKGDGAVTAFSGGVDSAFTLRRNLSSPVSWGREDIREAVFVSGLDIPVDDRATADGAYLRNQRFLDATGVTVAYVRTDLRSLKQRWTDVFGLAVASSLLLFQQDRSLGLIGSSEPYDSLVLPWGSTPVQDWMASTGLMEIRHDGAGYSRTEKVAELASWPEALFHLRVCWAGDELDRNCGRCEKCVRTVLNFWVTGHDTPQCFDRSPKADDIQRIRLRYPALRAEFESLLSAAKRNGLSNEWWARSLRHLLRTAKVRAALGGYKRRLGRILT